MTREFTIAIEVTTTVDLEDWDEENLAEAIDRFALNVIGAILEHNPEYDVRRLRSYIIEGWG